MTEGDGKYVKLGDLLVYRLALKVSLDSWQIYEKMSWQIRKIIGDQFITAIDSVGANTAEGYGRYHYLDRIKFYYNARASLFESKHWCFLMHKRNLIGQTEYDNILGQLNFVHVQLNIYIRSCYKNK